MYYTLNKIRLKNHMAKDYYKTLGVSKGASAEEIKKAFKALAKANHPDRNPNNREESEKKFKEIGEAYEVLGDASKRQRYDSGASDFSSASSGGGGGGAGGFGGFGGFGGGGHAGMDFNDIFGGFESFFGQQGGQRGASGRTMQSGADLKYSMHVTLEEAFFGKSEEIQFDALTACDSCDGTGSKDKKSEACASCGGSGKTRFQRGFFIMEQTCEKCSGVGEVPKNACASCRGAGAVKKTRTVSFKIPEGIEDGVSIRLAGKGESGLKGGKAGDLYVNVSVKKHKTFTRKGDDLVCSVPVRFSTAALGGKISVKTIDGEMETVAIPAGTQTGTEFRVKGKGMKVMSSGGKRGDMRVVVGVSVPTKLTADQKRIIEEFDKSFGEGSSSDEHSGFFNSFMGKFK